MFALETGLACNCARSLSRLGWHATVHVRSRDWVGMQLCVFALVAVVVATDAAADDVAVSLQAHASPKWRMATSRLPDRQPPV
jgi:hypothetical protein